MKHIPGRSEFASAASIKTIGVNVNVWQDLTGSPQGQFLDTPTNRSRLANLINDINDDYFTNVDAPSDPPEIMSFQWPLSNIQCIGPDSTHYSCLNDTRIRFYVNGVNFLDVPEGFNTGCLNYTGIDSLSRIHVPEYEGMLNVHFVARGNCSSGASGAAPSPLPFGFVPTTISVNPIEGANKTIVPIGFYRQHLAHEIGHLFNLRHTYESGYSETLNSGSPEFLKDVFPIALEEQPWCPFGTYCYFSGISSCSPNASPIDTCTNNIMGNNDSSRFVSPYQIGRMHQYLMTSSIGSCAWGYDPVPFVLDSSRTFRGRYKFFQDFVIPAGKTLTVQCTLEFDPGARLIVEPGAKLIIDGGTVRAGEFATEAWRGIEIRGFALASQDPDPADPEYLQYQGMLIMRNGGRIENAEVGVYLGNRDVPNNDGGGIFISEGTASDPVQISNCITGISFRPYDPFFSGAPSPINQSRIQHVLFTRDERALPTPSGSNTLNSHIYLEFIPGLEVKGCTFSNDQPDITDSELRGRGISGIASSIDILPACPNGAPNCPGATVERSTFTGLTRGIELESGSLVCNANIRSADFMNNGVAIFASEITSVDIRACSFANTQPGITTSTALGQGITSANSTLTVRPGCPNGADECTGQTLVRNTFTNLDHGIELFDTGFGSYATIHQNDFTNNIAGIYANGMTGFAVTENLFTVGDNAVGLVGDVDISFNGFHRALFSTVSYGFIIRDNTLVQASTGVAQPLVGTEGIVVGYTRDHNDVVFRNNATGLERAFVGEGISADVSNSYSGRIVGLQFHCNESDNNAVNFLSRTVNTNDEFEMAQQTIRYFQGDRRPADNRFDLWPLDTPDRWDFSVDTETPLDYFFREPITSGQWIYRPLSYTTDPPRLFPHERPNLIGSICNDRPSYNLDQLSNMEGTGLMEDLEDQLLVAKLAYGNVRFIHQQMVDGGDHDEVVQEISSTWPNEAWQLRQYLLDLSPFLSTESLKNAVNKPSFPMAMKAEVCIANPDATKKEGFTKWLLTEALEPMPEYLVQLIEQSWDTRTFRTDMELELAEHHATLSYMANEMRYVEHQQAQPSAAVVRGTWQQVRTTAARYAEANIWLGEGNYSAAHNVVSSIPQEHDLRSPEQLERLRMLDYITLLQNAANAGRAAHELTTAEVNQLKAMSDGQYDRAANWISNLLCVYYGHCRPPRTGGEVGGDKNLRTQNSQLPPLRDNVIHLAPNPAQTWVTLTYSLLEEPANGWVHVKDVTGRSLISERLAGIEGQLVLDTRQLAKGTYTVECTSDEALLKTERLIVQ
jgi:hypothetical protein